ncbi:hypothetical protein NIES2119_14410 [[Phormidium ambiguum] IAM M-71]|uniref:Uncharacterized protein n=1 Tax=[Phormidium ambiguum] IAM M-71 TaxID=454136 RepID=A0A1U7IIT6_9CYAN|nr:hypothetical protein NIES2119_14410 [Phormidium ambiguum IAM M-71]
MAKGGKGKKGKGEKGKRGQFEFFTSAFCLVSTINFPVIVRFIFRHKYEKFIFKDSQELKL